MNPQPGKAMAELARSVFDREPGMYGGVELHPAERRLLAEIGPNWGKMSMLDLGIGSGRTTLTFGAICREYVGIDFSTEMVRLARERAAGIAQASIQPGDARAMPEFADASFDVVLFSFNGIDSIDHEGRLATLREVCRVLRPGGLFVFSSHVLAQPRYALGRFQWGRPLFSLRVALGALRNRAMFRLANGVVDFPALAARGHATFFEAHRFTLALYYVAADECARQVAAAGLQLTDVVDTSSRRLDPPYHTADPWLFYWCRRSA